MKLIGDEHEALGARTGIATAQMKAGDFKGALRTLQTIADEDKFSDVLEDLAATQAEAGHAAAARHWTGALKSPTARSRVFLGIARGISKRNKDRGRLTGRP